MVTLIDTAEDMVWLAGRFNVPGEWGSAVIHGNEDAPERIELFYSASPLYNQQPDSLLTQGNCPFL